MSHVLQKHFLIGIQSFEKKISSLLYIALFRNLVKTDSKLILDTSDDGLVDHFEEKVISIEFEFVSKKDRTL